MPFQDLHKALSDAGFTISTESIDLLIKGFVDEQEAGGVTMGQFIRMYHHLDNNDEGIEMV